MLTKEQIKNNVVYNFKHARKGLGKTLKEMGVLLGLPLKTYAAIEEGRATPVHHVYRLSLLINVSLDTLITTKLNA